jgi:hypothetical protein
MTLMLKRGVMLKRSVLLKRGRNRPAADLASCQDACYTRWPGRLLWGCIPATRIDAFVGGTNAGRCGQDARRAIIAASPVVFQL